MASLDSDAWQHAIIEEYQAIIDAGIWEEVEMKDLPIGRKLVSSHRVFKIKRNADRSVERFKTRIVAKGYSQVEGLDYDKTFAPVTRYDSLRLIIALALHLGLDMSQADIKSAFLDGDLNKEVWMMPTPGIGLDGKVLCLRKSLYGLKQALLAWFERLSSALAELGFLSCSFDSCVFISPDYNVTIVVYVDDITTVGRKSDVRKVYQHLTKHFTVTIKEGLSYLLGIEILHTATSLELRQTQYITNILTHFGMEHSRPVSTPIDPKAPLVKADESEPAYEKQLYQQMIGSLMYLVTCTRSDLGFVVSFLSQFSSQPLLCHHTAVKRVFRYLAGTSSTFLVYTRRSSMDIPLLITSYSDADYASCRNTRRSVSGYIFLLNGCAISWLSKKQNSVSTSTTESEYIALAATARQALWHINGRSQLGFTIPVELKANNTSSINVAENPINNPKTKHINVSYHFNREHLIRRSFTLCYILTGENLAGIMTKRLLSVLHNRHTQGLGLTE